MLKVVLNTSVFVRVDPCSLVATNVERLQATQGNGVEWLDASAPDLFFGQPDTVANKVQ